jgi:hypothetical protein
LARVSSVSRSLRVRGFPALAGSYALNELGDNLGVIALAILVLDRTGSALATTALFLAAKFIPAFAFAVTSAAGPVLAGLIVHEWGVATALWADAASFLAVAMVLLINARSLPVPEAGTREHWWPRLIDGLSYVRSHATAGA